MKHFYIDPAYLTSVTETVVTYNELSDTVSLFDLIKKPILHTSTSSKDHPKFSKLRDKLASLGYIHKVDNYWNGDRVLKPFYLNDVKFKKDDQFACACAMAFTLSKR